MDKAFLSRDTTAASFSLQIKLKLNSRTKISRIFQPRRNGDSDLLLLKRLIVVIWS